MGEHVSNQWQAAIPAPALPVEQAAAALPSISDILLLSRAVRESVAAKGGDLSTDQLFALFQDIQPAIVNDTEWAEIRSTAAPKTASSPCTDNPASVSGGSESESAETNEPSVKKKRKTWSEEVKMRIVRADMLKGREGRLAAADVEQMSHNVADKIIARWRKTENLTDGRKLHHGPSPRTKLHPRHKDYLRQFLEEDSTLTLDSLRECLNEEILRELLVKHKAGISESERGFGEKITFDYRTWFAEHEEVRAQYEAAMVRSHSTIGQALVCMIYTRKLSKPIRITMNCEAYRKKRVPFCESLKQYADGSIPADLYFMDEMPFFVSQHRRHGRSSWGKRATITVPPGSAMSIRTQVALAVHPRFGILHSSINKPEKLVLTSKGGRQRKQCAQVWSADKFVSFMDELMTIVKARTEQQCASDGPGGMFDKPYAVFVYDGAPEISESTIERVTQLGSCKALDSLLHERHGHGQFTGVLLCKMPPVTSYLNLSEYYNRTLRMEAQKQMDKKENKDVMLGLRPLQGTSGSVIDDRLEVLRRCITGGLQVLEEHGVQLASWAKVIEIANACLLARGALNPSEPNWP